MLLELDFDIIENFKYIDPNFTGKYYDPQNKYSVAYTYGMMGIIYNEDQVSEVDIADQSWGLLWNEKYTGKILQFNNPRDAFATAMYWKGLDVNSTDPDVWDAALDLLKQQKPVLQGYVNDEIFNKMTTGSAAIAPYFVGDYLVMADTEGAPSLGFYYPKEGVNYFIDAMCIPKSSKNPEIANEYINFMLSKEASIANALYIGYASPNTLCYEDEGYIEEMGEEAIELLYGVSPLEVNADYNKKFGSNDASCYCSFEPHIQTRVNTLWENLKLANSTEVWVHVFAITITVSVISFAVYSVYMKKKRSRNYRLRDKKAKAEKAKLKNRA